MARYIDADELYKETEKKIAAAHSYRMAVVDDEFLDLINDAFTEDVVPKSEDTVEVVRCKDCVYFKQSVSPLCPNATAFICDFPYGLQKNVSEKDFCCHGEKLDSDATPDPAASREVEQLIYKLECLLCHATGNRLSKHTYDLRTMESAVTDYVERCCDEARAEAKSEVDKWYCEYHAIKDELKQEKMYHSETEKLADRYCAELQTAKTEVDQLKKDLEAKDTEYSQALHDKAREYNMVVDKICIEHRAEYARLHETHQEELAKAKREVARKIFADIELLIDKYSIEHNYLLLHLRKDIAEFKKQHNKN